MASLPRGESGALGADAVARRGVFLPRPAKIASAAAGKRNRLM
jgi:hypothetical protein